MKDVQNREHTALAKPLVAIGELQCDYVSSKNDQPNKKTYFAIESSIINTNSNITDNMMRTVMYSRKNVGLRMEP